MSKVDTMRSLPKFPPVVEVRLSAEEIMDHVDDMLAWEAIASQAPIVIEHSQFFRAVPLVRVGADHWGVLTPTSLVASEQIVDRDTEAYRARLTAASTFYEERFLPKFLEDFKHRAVRYAEIRECDSSANIVGAGIDHPSLRGDDVSDLVATDARSWVGVTYQIETIAELNRETAQDVRRRCKLPQIARVFVCQNVFTFRDGRATSDQTTFAYWNRGFYGVNDRKRLAVEIGSGSGKYYHPSFQTLGNALAACLARRVIWGIELKLGARRTGVELCTDAIGARAFVRMLRAAESSSGRRKSIVHWVNDHMRRRRANNVAADVFVRGHLRGLENVPCGRYHARIWPAQHLVDKTPSRRS